MFSNKTKGQTAHLLILSRTLVNSNSEDIDLTNYGGESMIKIH